MHRFEMTQLRILALTLTGLLITSLLSGCSRCSAEKQPLSGPRNLLLIVVDTLKAEQLALYGGPTETPNVEALAARGVLFENAYSHAPITGPSHASLFTSSHVFEHGVQNNADVLSDDRPTLAELMEGAGRDTVAFISLEALKSKFGVLRGFDEIHEEFPKYWWRTAGELNEEVLPWLDKNASEPFFAFVHYSDPHGPYTPPSWYQTVELTLNGEALPPTVMDGRYTVLELDLKSGDNALVMKNTGDHPLHLSRWKMPKNVTISFDGPWRGEGEKRRPMARVLDPGAAPTLRIHNSASDGKHTIKIKSHFVLSAEKQREGYAAETAYADGEIGRLLDRLKALGHYEDTVVVLTGDHGEELGEHTGKFQHVQHLHECLVHIPLIVALPGGEHAGTRVKATVRHVDVLPTLAKIFGFDAPSDARGRNLLPPSEVKPRPAFFETHRPQARHDMHGMRDLNHKLIVDETVKRESLYDLTRDRKEKRDLLKKPTENDKKTAKRIRDLTALLKSAEATAPVRAELSEEDVEALKALGYIE